MRLILTLIALTFSSSAGAMTCAEFRTGLDKAIVAGGRRVPSPHFKIVPGAAAQPDDGSIPGLDTLLTCSDGGVLQAIDITATIEGENDADDLRRHVRFNAMVGATLCTVEPRAANACYMDAEQAQLTAIKKFLDAKRQGVDQPSGFDLLSFRKLDASPVVKATSGTITFDLDFTH